MTHLALPRRTVGDVSVEAGRGPGQLGWYRFAARLVRGKRVLDAGCGMGQGLDLLAARAAEVRGQDLDPRLADLRTDIIVAPLSQIPDKSFDVVTSIDVVEHVEDDAGFVRTLARIAREAIFLTTPNWTISRCAWPFHLREYTPAQFEALLAPLGEVRLYKGNARGDRVHPVVWRGTYHLFNQLRIHPATALAARCWGRTLPRALRIGGHNAAWVRLR